MNLLGLSNTFGKNRRFWSSLLEILSIRSFLL